MHDRKRKLQLLFTSLIIHSLLSLAGAMKRVSGIVVKSTISTRVMVVCTRQSVIRSSRLSKLPPRKSIGAVEPMLRVLLSPPL